MKLEIVHHENIHQTYIFDIDIYNRDPTVEWPRNHLATVFYSFGDLTYIGFHTNKLFDFSEVTQIVDEYWAWRANHPNYFNKPYDK